MRIDRHEDQERSAADSPIRFDHRTPYPVLDRAHRTLRYGLAQLRAAIAADAPGNPEVLALEIGAVRSSLAAHFAFEENYGSLHYLVATRPGLQPQLAELRAEHRAILDALDRVRLGLDRGLPHATLSTAMSSVLERLANHELNQHELVRRAVLHSA